MPPPEPLRDERLHTSVIGNADPKRRVLIVATVVVGSALIGATLRLPRGSTGLYIAGFALAAVWIVSSLLYGPVQWRSPTLTLQAELAAGVVLGVLTFGLFLGGSQIGKQITVLAGPIHSVLGKADAGSLAAVLTVALVNGLAEEMFFRGALIDAIGPHHALVLSVILYVGVTAVSGNAALTLAAIIMGAVFVIERHITGALLAPIVTHLVWSTLIILLLPR